MGKAHPEPMKIWCGIGLLAAVVIAFAAWFSTPARVPAEPSYAGRTLTQWIMPNPTAVGQPIRSPEATEAIRHMGTNALPCLLAWLGADPEYTPIKEKAHVLLRALPRTVTPKVVLHWADSDQVTLHLRAAPMAFKVFGPDAAPAIPQLERLASDPRGRLSAYFATYILVDLGPEGYAALQRIAQNPACPTRDDATRMMAQYISKSLEGQ
jgi:hypothetical protein